jgi:hypothetical protein
MNDVSPVLESLMDELRDLSISSSLPENVDREFWNQWLIDVYDNSFRGLL